MSRPLHVRAQAPAKVNLRLEVLGRRADGFHEVRTSMLALGLHDLLEARHHPGGEVRLSVRGEHASRDVPSGARNLVARAADSVLEEGRRRGALGVADGIELVLEKRVPSRAGLGGGSSDAAAAWMASEAALGIALGDEVRAETLARIGSDCAFFAAARETGFALCTGRGDRVAPATGPAAGFFVALVVPAVACGTASVYAALDRGPATGRPSEDPPPGWLAGPASRARPFLVNRLEPAALAAFPDLRRWRDLLDRRGLSHWRLSGSGSAFFGIYDGREEAESARDELRTACREASLEARCAWAGPPAGRGANIVEIR